ncbi:MAG: ParB/RepB/Spo0J family partition protein, partial [Clostridia bacterium]
MNSGKKGLGKGLSALFSVYDDEVKDMEIKTEIRPSVNSAFNVEQGVSDIDLNLIVTNPNQPRKNFDQVSLLELADSIKMHGVIQPIVLNENEGKFVIIAGERRYRAAKIAGLTKIPSVVKHYTDRQIKEISII